MQGRILERRAAADRQTLKASRVQSLVAAGTQSLSEGDFRSEYTVVDEYGWTQLVFRSDHCVFLRGNRCSVYAARPTQCRTFPFWRSLVSGGEWTPEAQELCEGVGRGRSYDPVEVEERMLAFELSNEE